MEWLQIIWSHLPDVGRVAQLTEILKNLVLAGAGLVAAYVALKGLHEWRHKIHHEKQYEMASRVRTAYFGLRSAVRILEKDYLGSKENVEKIFAENSAANLVKFVDYLCKDITSKRLERIEQYNVAVFELVPEASGILGPRIENDLSELVGRTNSLIHNVDSLKRELYGGSDYYWLSDEKKVNEFSKPDRVKQKIATIYGHREDASAALDLSRTIAQLEEYMTQADWIGPEASALRS